MVGRREDLTLPMASEKVKERLLEQLSMSEIKGSTLNKTQRDVAWERRKLQKKKLLQKSVSINHSHEQTKLTDEDLDELKGSIELGFGFNEKAGQKLCNTLPALDLYFAVNRQLSPLPSVGGNPQQVKQRLRHWAQAVACSVIQSS